MNKNAYSLMMKSNSIAIFTHTTPDCDGVGSSVALKLHLESLGKKVHLFCDDSIPTYLNFIPFINEYKNENYNKEIYDLGIILDCVDLSRIGNCSKIFNGINNTIVIDHHEEFENFATINISNPKASSTGEMMYKFFKENNILLTDDIAMCLYASICADTGGFIHNNTSPETFKLISDLIQYNFDYISINEKLFKTKTIEQVNLLKTALNNIQYINNDAIISVLTLNDFANCNATFADTLGIINTISGINGINLSILLSEKTNNEFVLSIRTKGNVSANKLAKLYGGGGHFNAAGCRIVGKINYILPKLFINIGKVMNNEYCD